jgi:hypothetical protein
MPAWCVCGDRDCPSAISLCAMDVDDDGPCAQCENQKRNHRCRRLKKVTPMDISRPYQVALFDAEISPEDIARFNRDEIGLGYETTAYYDPQLNDYVEFYYPTWKAARESFWDALQHYTGRDISEFYIIKWVDDKTQIMTSPPEEERIEDSNTRKRNMVNISFKKKDGHTLMVVDARELQAILDSLGAVHRDGRYMDRPVFNNQVVDAATHKLSSEVFLIRPGSGGSLPEFDLTAVYNRPISKANLETLGESAEGVVRMILDHYQAVDITVDLRKKVVA